MVHRIVAAALVMAMTLALPLSGAFGFCRTTTCAVKTPPATCMRDADGCWTTGIPLSWPQRCVSFAVNSAGSPRLGLDYDAALAIVQKAFSLWPNAACSDGSPSIAYTSRDGLTCDRVEYNPTGPNANAIIFRDQGWTHDPNAIALTTVAFSVKTGKILDADMEINSGTYPLSQFDLEFVVAHESGHFSGLDHSPLTTAVMFFQYASDNIGDTRLTSDDADAICAAYPPTRDTPVCDAEPDKGFATDCGGDVLAACAVAPVTAAAAGWPGEWIAALVIVGAALLYRWRGRRRRHRQASQAGSRPRSA
jgi:Matrixin